MKKTMSKKSLILALIALIVVVGAFIGIWAATRPETQVGDKTITVTVVHKDAAEKDFEISTDAEMLRGALEQSTLFRATRANTACSSRPWMAIPRTTPHRSGGA